MGPGGAASPESTFPFHLFSVNTAGQRGVTGRQRRNAIVPQEKQGDSDPGRRRPPSRAHALEDLGDSAFQNFAKEVRAPEAVSPAHGPPRAAAAGQVVPAPSPASTLLDPAPDSVTYFQLIYGSRRPT